jgi:radical SAM protein with 4Fe4S-binding SPASM domain
MLNPAYMVKPDMGRALLLERQGVRLNILNEENFDHFIHPIFAIILNCMDGSDLKDSVGEASEILGVDKEIISNFVKQLIHNKERVAFNFDGIYHIFPKNCLIVANEKFNHRKKLDYELFLYDELDLRNKRHYIPTDLTFMINTICETDCFYCYADRRIKMNCKIPFERIKEIVKEAYSLHVRTIDILGGEFFLYKKWEELLLLLKEYEYFPYISTKVPLEEEDVIKLKNIGVIDLQISLDSLIPEHLIQILKVKEDYINRIKETIILLDKYEIKIIIHTILTSINQTKEDLDSIYDFIKDIKNIKSWRIDAAESSLYRTNNYSTFSPQREQVDVLYNYLKNSKSSIRINYSSLEPKKKPVTYHEKLKEFNDRAICSANLSSLFILPDGKVTICEELYWNPDFIVGNILNQSLSEIWNSDRCKYLYIMPQKDIPEDSPCSACDEYYSCKQFVQTCVRDTIKVYGKDKWYYPDVRCPKAPPVKENIRI